MYTQWVEDPEVYQEQSIIYGQKSYLSYLVCSKLPGRDLLATRHRYNDFQVLRKKLRDVYAPLGIFVPPLPPKNDIIGPVSVGDPLVKERIFGLTLFCEVCDLK